MKYGIYVHIPFCKAKCKYCAFVSSTDLSIQHAYVKRLKQEIASCSNLNINADSIYLGGGTPSCLYRGAIQDILTAVKNSFTIDYNAEVTVECNPESCDDAFAAECAENGVNRISIGLQSADDSVLKRIGRIHSAKDFIGAVKILQRNGFTNISSDIILGLPLSTEQTIKKSLDMIIEFCTHVSAYALNVEQGTPLYEEGYCCDDDMIADLYDFTYDYLSVARFSRYEVSNFAKNGEISKHNYKYWTLLPYLGFGVAAHGYDGKYTRYYHSDNLKDYFDGKKIQTTVLTEKDLYNEFVMLALRTERGIVRHDFEQRFGYDITENPFVMNHVVQNNVIVDAETVRIAPDKMFVMNGIIQDIMK